MSWALVSAFGSAAQRGDTTLDNIPALLKKILAEDAWREFITPRGERVTHERFEDFLTTPPTKGAGVQVATLKRLLRDDNEALNALDTALQRPAGNPNMGKSIDDNIHNSEREGGAAQPERASPAGTTKAQALRRLRKDRPDLLEQVLAERLTAHAAMIEAGFRPRTFTVRADNPEKVAATLKKNLSAEALARLKEMI